MPDLLIEILLIFFLIFLNGLFAMSEIALVSARKVRMQQRADDGDKGAQTALQLMANPNRLLSSVQIGITLIGVLAGAVGGAALADPLAAAIAQTPVLQPYAHAIALALVVLLTTYFSLVIGELIPKRLAMNDPERIATLVASPMRIISLITAPVIKLLSASTDLGLRVLGTVPSKEPPVTEEEIKVLIEQGTQVGVFEESEQDMVTGVLRLGERDVDAVMTPRTEIEWIDLDETLPEIIQKVEASVHSRFPVAQGSLDNVLGILETRKMLAQQLSGQAVDLHSLIEPPLYVPDSMSALNVLEQFRETGNHIALVIDEYGGLLGMITLYDMLEAIVGDLPTIGEENEPSILRREDGSYLLDGLLPVDELKDLLDLDSLPDENRVGYQTLGGFMMSQLGAIPLSGQHIEWNGWHFEVVDMDGRRIDKVLVIRCA